MSVRKREWTTSKGEAKQAWVVDYADQEGIRRLKTFSKKKDADAWRNQTSVAVRRGEHVPDSASITVRQAGAEWLKACEAADLERTTIDQYRQHLDLHILPFLGNEKLTHINVPTVKALQTRLRQEGRSPAMVRIVTTSLGSLLAEAQESGRVSHNAVRELKKRRTASTSPQQRHKARLEVGVDIPTPADARRIVEAAKGRYRPLIITAIFSGLRASELRGLRWSDVDLNKSEIHVKQRADRFNKIGPPKSAAARRTVPVNPIVINTLREWKLKCPKGELDLVFPNGSGNIESHGNIINRGLLPTVNDAGVPQYTGLHCLRHFFASWLINAPPLGLGLSGKVVQERMGHSTLAMTMDRYGHLFPRGDDAKVLAEAERAFFAT